MKKVEEFQAKQKLIDELREFDNKVLELKSKIEENEKRANRRIESLEDQSSLTWEDVKFGIDSSSLQEEIKKQIKKEQDNLEIENKKIEEEIEEEIEKNNKEFEENFHIDEHLKNITMEIEEMKKEVSREELELKKKDIELQEFYMEENHENPFKWKEIYKEKDVLRKNIAELSARIEEYSKFKEKLYNIFFGKLESTKRK